MINQEGDLFEDTCSLATHAATEIDAILYGRDIGIRASPRFAQVLSERESRAQTPEERLSRFNFDPAIAAIAYHVLQEVGYVAPGTQEDTSQVIRNMDRFALELEGIATTPKVRLPLLKKACLKFSEHLAGFHDVFDVV